MATTFRTLFTGGGLCDIGFQQAGWRGVDGFEWDAGITSVARQNDIDCHTADVRNVDYATLPSVDHLHASPSCKNASQANAGAGETGFDIECAQAIASAIDAHTGLTFSLENVWRYRTFESFDLIKAALRRNGFKYQYSNVNAADFGVPQTRKRLILRAVRGGQVPVLQPTHRQYGDMFSPAWIGWYEAIEDLIESLPETQPAPWQIQRLQRAFAGSVAIHATDMRTMPIREGKEPIFTIMAGSGSAPHIRAFVVDGANASREITVREHSQPMFTTTSQQDRVPIRALIIDGQPNNHGTTITARHGGEPTFTTMASQDNKPLRAWLCGGGNTNLDHPTSRAHAAHEPTFTTRSAPDRAFFSNGRWVKLDLRCYARFQTVLANYKSLTAEINGNGVPCLLAQRIAESLSVVYS